MLSGYTLKQKILIFFSNALLWIGLDQWTKIWSVANLKGEATRFYFNGIAQLTYAENNGAWGNLGGTWGEPWRSIFLIVVPIVVLLAISITAIVNNKATKLETWSYILISCGGLGNIIDRVRFGHVVDFLYVGLGKWPWQTNIFNVADVIIMTGFGIMLLHMFKDRRRQKNSQ